VRPVAKDLDRVIGYFGKIEERYVELEAAGFDLGIIENIVDQPQYMATAFPYQPDIFAILLVADRPMGLAIDQFDKAEHPGQRGA
jgi:hypothetical protein